MVIVSFIPAMPIPVLTGAIGTVFDFWTTLIICWGGSTLGSFFMFLLSRYLFKGKALRHIQRQKKIATLFRLLEKNAFISIFIGRLIPILPSVSINIICSVTKISGTIFFTATLLGKLPTMVTFALAGNNLQANTKITVALVLLYGLLIYLGGKKLRKRLEIL